MSISKQYDRVGEGEILGVSYTITVQGIIMDDMGSPNSSGVFWNQPGYPPNETISEESKLGSILRKQKAIRDLFSKANDGKTFEIQSGDGTQPIKANVKILSVEFPEGLWNNRSEYVITLAADRIFPFTDDNEAPHILDASESWSIEPQDEREEVNQQFLPTYQLTHSISAQGKRIFEETGEISKEPWEWAKEWVVSKMGFDQDVLDNSILGLSSYSGYDYVKSEVIDKQSGQYSIEETWKLAVDKAIEQYEVSLTKGIDSYINTVSIQGTITGLEENDGDTILSSRIDNAELKFTSVKDEFYTRCQAHLGVYGNGVLHEDPRQETVGKSPSTGVITYTYEYDNRPENLIEGALSEVVNVNYIDRGESFASVFVLGRRHGPVLQDLGTSEALQKNLNIEFVIQPTIDSNNIAGSFQFPDHLVSNLVTQLDPLVADGAVQSFKGSPNKNYDPYSGRASYSVSWTYEK